MISDSVKTLLLDEARRINTPAFIPDDPVQFPRRFIASKPDAEIAAILCAHIAWGRRQMICRDCERLLAILGPSPLQFTLSQAYEQIPDDICVHRTFFGRNLKHFLRGLRRIYLAHPSLDHFCQACGAPLSEFPAWHLAEAINSELRLANDGVDDSRCLPLNLTSTPLKRLNMALRWLVRRDGIVDLGLWQSLSPSQLFIPLDVHVGDTARALGITSRRANDRRTCLEITQAARLIAPDDPALLDFALFGIPIT